MFKCALAACTDESCQCAPCPVGNERPVQHLLRGGGDEFAPDVQDAHGQIEPASRVERELPGISRSGCHVLLGCLLQPSCWVDAKASKTCAAPLFSGLTPTATASSQVKISNASQQMMTVKIMAEKEGRHDEFIGVVVVPVSRIMAGECCA